MTEEKKMSNAEIIRTVYEKWKEEMALLDREDEEGRSPAFREAPPVREMLIDFWAAVEAAYLDLAK